MTTHTCACGALADGDDWAGWAMCSYCIARFRREIAEERDDEWWGGVPA